MMRSRGRWLEYGEKNTKYKIYIIGAYLPNQPYNWVG